MIGLVAQAGVAEIHLQVAVHREKSPGEVLRELAFAVLTQYGSQPLEVSEDSLEKTCDREALRRSADRVLSRLRLGKQSQGAKAINQFIKELRD